MITHTGALHRLLFPSLIWQMPAGKVFLTFDDGPHPTATDAVLDVLKEFGVPATFFLSGANIPGRERIVERIEAEGHAIGIHAYHHTRMMALSKERTKEEIRSTASLLHGIVRQPVRFFRPPFGFFSWNTIAAAREEGYYLMMWSCLTGDFSSQSDDVTVQKSLELLDRGSILVYHDNDLTQHKIAGILRRVIPQIQARGFSLGAIR
ncbi:MAG: polysaccharide deacetylase family protein [Bacteroidetes bacterium]|nr:polysaccharide deacetylase family protein [Bacteroidota bacterium]